MSDMNYGIPATQGQQSLRDQYFPPQRSAAGEGMSPVQPMRRFGINRNGERLTRLAGTSKNGNETVFAYDGDHKKSCPPDHLAVDGHLFETAAAALDAFAEWAAQRGRLGSMSVQALPEERYALIEYRAKPTMIEWVPTIVSDF